MAQSPDDTDGTETTPAQEDPVTASFADQPGDHPGRPDLAAAAELEEVYQTDNAIAASFVIHEVLGPAGIEAYSHDRRSGMIPAPAAMPGEIGIAVPAAHAERARQLLREARADQVLDEDGQLVGDEEETGVA